MKNNIRATTRVGNAININPTQIICIEDDKLGAVITMTNRIVVGVEEKSDDLIAQMDDFNAPELSCD